MWPKRFAIELTDFENFLNNLIPDIKIKFEISETSANFLDTTVYIDKANNTLKTKVFFKSTDTHQLLHKQSFHPKHTFNGIIKSQLIRFKRLSSTKTDYDNTCKILFDQIRNRGYTLSKLRKEQYNIWFNYTPNKNTKRTTIETKNCYQ